MMQSLGRMEIHVRDMEFEDIPVLAEAFGINQGWADKTPELFTRYFNEQSEGKRQVLVALYDNHIAGYLTLLPNDTQGAFANKNIPTICDFNVLAKFQRRGIGTALMDEIEAVAKQTSDEICLGVGLYTSYGTAQRIYVKRGYIPDGSGCWYKNKNLPPYQPCLNDDDLILYMSKKLLEV
ncbi:MAG: GNAT family N-acetyltransferase [Defluviitaleaceae bacterium]|nr:GNAT family N-acetyltransferase [Defluviitaleaceae bacterium]